MPSMEICQGAGTSSDERIYILAIKAESDPQVLLRVSGLFAQRSIIPRQISCRRYKNFLIIDIEVDLLDSQVVNTLIEKIRSIILVNRVSLIEGKL